MYIYPLIYPDGSDTMSPLTLGGTIRSTV